MTVPFGAQEFASIFRDRDHPRWKDAYDLVHHRIATILRGETTLGRAVQLDADDESDVASQLTAEFWLFINANPGVLLASSVQGFGAIYRQIIRFLGVWSSNSIEIATLRLQAHLRNKMRAVLRDRSFVEVSTRVWAANAAYEVVADESMVQRLMRTQPPLRAVWVRNEQLPPVALPRDIFAHLNALFGGCNCAIRLGDLTRLLWAALSPPSTAFPWVIDEAPDGHPEDWGEGMIAAGGHRDPDLAMALQQFMDELPTEMRMIVMSRFGPSSNSIREIEEQTGIAKSTIARRLADFQANLSALLAAGGYSDSDSEVILTAFRDTIFA